MKNVILIEAITEISENRNWLLKKRTEINTIGYAVTAVGFLRGQNPGAIIPNTKVSPWRFKTATIIAFLDRFEKSLSKEASDAFEADMEYSDTVSPYRRFRHAQRFFEENIEENLPFFQGPVVAILKGAETEILPNIQIPGCEIVKSVNYSEIVSGLNAIEVISIKGNPTQLVSEVNGKLFLKTMSSRDEFGPNYTFVLPSGYYPRYNVEQVVEGTSNAYLDAAAWISSIYDSDFMQSFLS